jgi:outer membrane putative beta-barrel porin/alpha-amylase
VRFRNMTDREYQSEPPRRTSGSFALVLVALGALILSSSTSPLAAQSIEPRNYSNAPVGASFLIGGLAATDGGLAIDPAVPLTEPELRTWSGVVGYARFIDFWGKSAKFDVIVPYTFLSGNALFDGAPVEREISGLSDPAFRLLVNFYGAPALSPGEFKNYHQDLIVGASVQVTTPVGQYDETRLVNIGMNRWTVKSEVGVSKTVRAWTIEGSAAVTLFTDNDDFNRGKLREQAPMYSSQGHVVYNFPRGRWASFDVTYFAGGETTIDGTDKNDLQKNWRLGATYAFPVSVQNSIKLYASSGVSARTGNSFDLLGIAFQHRWSGLPWRTRSSSQ